MAEASPVSYHQRDEQTVSSEQVVECVTSNLQRFLKTFGSERKSILLSFWSNINPTPFPPTSFSVCFFLSGSPQKPLAIFQILELGLP